MTFLTILESLSGRHWALSAVRTSPCRLKDIEHVTRCLGPKIHCFDATYMLLSLLVPVDPDPTPGVPLGPKAPKSEAAIANGRI